MMINTVEDKEAHLNAFARGVARLIAYSCSAMSEQEGMALVKDLECSRVELLFKTRMSPIQTTYSGYLVYPDGREVPCFEDKSTAPPEVGIGTKH
jgi:hypothetical protein